MVTKKVGIDIDDEEDDQDREDITSLYKDMEGSVSERLAIHKAIKGTARAHYYFAFKDGIKEDCVFELHELDSIRVGEDFTVNVSVLLKSQVEILFEISCVRSKFNDVGELILTLNHNFVK